MIPITDSNHLNFRLVRGKLRQDAVVDLVHTATGDRLLHFSYRPRTQTVVFNDCVSQVWGGELIFDVSGQGAIDIMVSLVSEDCIRIEASFADPFCFLKRVPSIPLNQLGLNCASLFTFTHTHVPNWNEFGRPKRLTTRISEHTSPEKLRSVLSGKTENDAVLIVGSAPSVKDHLSDVAAFKGDVWALNDAYFWLLENEIKPEVLFINDTRFVRKRAADLNLLEDPSIVTLHTVDTSEIDAQHPEISRLQVLGRDGFSEELGSVYHGCSVFTTALQCAVASGRTRIHIVGVMLPPPMLYSRIDGSVQLPEYVHTHQIRSVRLGMETLRRPTIDYKIYEASSNLQFL